MGDERRSVDRTSPIDKFGRNWARGLLRRVVAVSGVPWARYGKKHKFHHKFHHRARHRAPDLSGMERGVQAGRRLKGRGATGDSSTTMGDSAAFDSIPAKGIGPTKCESQMLSFVIA